MQKIKFDFEATKERIYAPNSNVPIGAPVDRNGNIANDGNAYGIVLCKETENEKYWVRYNLVVMVAGYCDIIDAQEIWGDEYSAEAIAAMSDIVFCDDHKIGGGGGGAMVVEVDYDGEQFVSTKTVDEVKNAMLTMPVIGIAKISGELIGVGIFTWLGDGEGSGFDSNSPMVTAAMYRESSSDSAYEILPLIAVTDGEFVINA